jgi:hypothetical protein
MRRRRGGNSAVRPSMWRRIDRRAGDLPMTEPAMDRPRGVASANSVIAMRPFGVKRFKKFSWSARRSSLDLVSSLFQRPVLVFAVKSSNTGRRLRSNSEKFVHGLFLARQ